MTAMLDDVVEVLEPIVADADLCVVDHPAMTVAGCVVTAPPVCR